MKYICSRIKIKKRHIHPVKIVVQQRRRFIRCSSYVLTRRPVIVKDLFIRGSINTYAAFMMYIVDKDFSNIKIIEGFLEDTFKVQLLSLLFHLVYDIYQEYVRFIQIEKHDLVCKDNEQRSK